MKKKKTKRNFDRNFLCNRMQKGARQGDAAAMDLERPLNYRREEEIDQAKGWGRR